MVSAPNGPQPCPSSPAAVNSARIWRHLAALPGLISEHQKQGRRAMGAHISQRKDRGPSQLALDSEIEVFGVRQNVVALIRRRICDGQKWGETDGPAAQGRRNEREALAGILAAGAALERLFEINQARADVVVAEGRVTRLEILPRGVDGCIENSGGGADAGFPGARRKIFCRKPLEGAGDHAKLLNRERSYRTW